MLFHHFILLSYNFLITATTPRATDLFADAVCPLFITSRTAKPQCLTWRQIFYAVSTSIAHNRPGSAAQLILTHINYPITDHGSVIHVIAIDETLKNKSTQSILTAYGQYQNVQSMIMACFSDLDTCFLNGSV